MLIPGHQFVYQICLILRILLQLYRRAANTVTCSVQRTVKNRPNVALYKRNKWRPVISGTARQRIESVPRLRLRLDSPQTNRVPDWSCQILFFAFVSTSFCFWNVFAGWCLCVLRASQSKGVRLLLSCTRFVHAVYIGCSTGRIADV